MQFLNSVIIPIHQYHDFTIGGVHGCRQIKTKLLLHLKRETMERVPGV